ncbi:hypothetical protein [Desulfomicrobium salsuginis]
MTRPRLHALLLSAVLFALIPSFSAFAGEVITVSPYWEGFTGPDGRGLYHDLMNAVFTRRGDTVRHLETPAKRGLIMVREGQADIYTCQAKAEDGLELARLPMYEGEFHALFLSRTFPHWNGVASLENKRLVWRLGYYSPHDFPVPVQFDETTTGTEALKRVVRESSDCYIDDYHLITETVNAYQPPLDSGNFRIESVGFRQYAPVFSASPRGRELRDAFEQGMRALAEQGKLLPIYEKWKLPMPRVYQR